MQIPLNAIQVLMLSGIGPESELKKHNIEQIVDLPVGQNLQDHCLVYAGFRVGKPKGQMTLDSLGLLNPLYLLQYIIGGGGPWSSTGTGALGVMHTPLNKFRLPGYFNLLECYFSQGYRVTTKSVTRKGSG